MKTEQNSAKLTLCREREQIFAASRYVFDYFWQLNNPETKMARPVTTVNGVMEFRGSLLR